MPILLFIIIISANDCDLRYKRTVNLNSYALSYLKKYENMVLQICAGL